MSTSTSSMSSAQDWGLPPSAHCRFTVEQFLELARQDRLGDVPCELLEGWIVPKVEGALEQLAGWDTPQMVRSSEHDAILDHVEELLRMMVPAGWYVRSQKALVGPESVPEPDAAVVRGKPADYFRKNPTGPDLALAIEVSLSTLTKDRRKARIFARCGVPKYVIVNVRDRCLEVFERPANSEAFDVYAAKQVLRGTQAVAVVVDNQVVGQLTSDDIFNEFPEVEDG